MPPRPLLLDFRQTLQHVVVALQTILSLPRIPRQVRTQLETLQAEVIAVLARSGRR